MSTFDISCPHCGQALEADESLVGQTLDCPACGKQLEVPAPFAAETPSVSNPETTPHARTGRMWKIPRKEVSSATPNTPHNTSRVISNTGRRWTVPSAAPQSSSARLISEAQQRKKSHAWLFVFLAVLAVAAGVGIFAMTGTSHRRTGSHDSQPEQKTRDETHPKPRMANASDLVPDDSSERKNWERKGAELTSLNAAAKLDIPFSFGPPTHHIRFEVKIHGPLSGKRLEDTSVAVVVAGRDADYVKSTAGIILANGFINDRTNNALLLVGLDKNKSYVPVRGLFANPPKWITVDVEFSGEEVVFHFNKQTFKVQGLRKNTAIWNIQFINNGMEVSFRNVTVFPDTDAASAPQTAEDRCLTMLTDLLGSQGRARELIRDLSGGTGPWRGMDDNLADYCFWASFGKLVGMSGQAVAQPLLTTSATSKEYLRKHGLSGSPLYGKDVIDLASGFLQIQVEERK